MENIDLAFVPYWILLYAKEEAITIDAKQYYIYHLYPQQVASAKETWDNIENIRPMAQPGEKVVVEF
ncbi:hypothetical protein [Neptunitalea chrysea]|nr:hypothetical protein [Neptunitalea chrysea]